MRIKIEKAGHGYGDRDKITIEAGIQPVVEIVLYDSPTIITDLRSERERQLWTRTQEPTDD